MLILKCNNNDNSFKLYVKYTTMNKKHAFIFAVSNKTVILMTSNNSKYLFTIVTNPWSRVYNAKKIIKLGEKD